MSLRDSQRLFNIAIRLQLYVEAVKAHQSAEFRAVAQEVYFEFRKLLFRVDAKSLDALTKAQLNVLVATLRASQRKVYSSYLEKIFKQLNDFMHASLTVNRIVNVSSFVELEEDEPHFIPTDKQASTFIEAENKKNNFIALFGLAAIATGSDKLWANIQSEPIAANGALLNPFLKSFGASAQLSMENTIRKGYSNSWSVSTTIAEAKKQIEKVTNQADAVLSTAIQHIEAIVSASVQSALFGQYRWVSVIDSGTTDICRGRNQKIYKHGTGPYPPAHIRCRSMIIPYRGGDVEIKDTFNRWIKRQPEKMQNFAFKKAITTEQFKDSAETIITG